MRLVQVSHNEEIVVMHLQSPRSESADESTPDTRSPFEWPEASYDLIWFDMTWWCNSQWNSHVFVEVLGLESWFCWPTLSIKMLANSFVAFWWEKKIQTKSPSIRQKVEMWKSGISFYRVLKGEGRSRGGRVTGEPLRIPFGEDWENLRGRLGESTTFP